MDPTRFDTLEAGQAEAARLAPEGSGERRHYFRFLPDVSTGNLLQIGALLVVAFTAYGTYQTDKAEQKAEVAQIKRDAESNREAVRTSISEIRTDIKEMQRTLIDVNQNVAVMKSRGEPVKAR